MILYNATKEEFHRNVESNTIDGIILSAYKQATGKSVGESKIRSWHNSFYSCYDRDKYQYIRPFERFSHILGRLVSIANLDENELL